MSLTMARWFLGVYITVGGIWLLSLTLPAWRTRGEEAKTRASKWSEVAAVEGAGAAFALWTVFLIIFLVSPGYFPGTQGFPLSEGAAAFFRLCGSLFLLGGLFLGIWSVRVMGAAWSFRARIGEKHRLVTEGPFRLVRHPIYAGFKLLYLGGLFLVLHWLMLVPLILGSIFDRFRARVEENLLLQEFGQEFKRYMENTGMFLPKIRSPVFLWTLVGAGIGYCLLHPYSMGVFRILHFHGHGGEPNFLSKFFSESLKAFHVHMWPMSLSYTALGGVFGFLYGKLRQREMRLREIERQETERMTQELSLARTIQMSLLPREVPAVEGLRLTGVSIPAREVGGDLFCYCPGEHGTMGVAIGDVVGKGVPAALMASLVKGSIHSRTDLWDKPTALVSHLNAVVCSLGVKHTVTFLYACWNPQDRSLTISNAGHVFPYILSGRSRSLTPLEIGALPLGIHPGTEYPEKRTVLEEGDFVVFLSDGVVEARGRRGELFGFDRLEELIRSGEFDTPISLVQRITEEVQEFSLGREASDDITVLAARAL